MKDRKLAFAGALVATILCTAHSANAAEVWTVHHGDTVIYLDHGLLMKYGIAIRSGADSDIDTAHEIRLETTPSETPILVGPDNTLSDGAFHHNEGLVISTVTGELVTDDLVVPFGGKNESKGSLRLEVHPANIAFDRAAGAVSIDSEEVSIPAELARALGNHRLAGLVIGKAITTVYLANMTGDVGLPGDDAAPHGGCTPSIGPDVIVGDLNGVSNYTKAGVIDAFSVGTTSCNIGSVNLQWIASSVNHPVIPQNMYRYKVVNGAGRFEQIGQSWMKHAFTALTQNLCCTCNGQGGSVLGIGCSDPYTAGRNGTQMTTTGGLGPRFQVNAHAGAFIWPYMFRGVQIPGFPNNSITRRLQVHQDDLNPTLNQGAMYWIEAQYVTPDDATAQNQNNNTSYRRVTISGTSDYNATISGGTFQQSPAIAAWKTLDAGVVETNIDTPEAPNGGGDTTGRLRLSAKATDLGNGVWHYEYALYNMNSDRSVSSVSIPVSPCTTLTDIGFHDVPYHSGDGYNSSAALVRTFDGTDWPAKVGGGEVTWALVPANPYLNSNALRWGTLYTYRFDANAPPTTGSIKLGMFKAVANQPWQVVAQTVVPTPVAGTAAAIGAIAPQSISAGSPFNLTPAIVGTAPFNWYLDAAPSGMTVNASTGEISWPNPVVSDTPYIIGVNAKNCAGGDSEVLTLTVTP